MKKIRENEIILNFPKTRNRQFTKYVNSEMMLELTEGLIDPQVIFDALTNEGKARVMARFITR